jgi:hypothetical protein
VLSRTTRLLISPRGLAWSRWGCVVSILPSGTGLQFRSLRCHPYDGTWDLSEPSDYPQINRSLDACPLQHVCWSPNGSDLAVIDASGRISIFTMTNSLNKPNLAKNGFIEPADDLHAVAGAYWLNLFPVQRAVCHHPLSLSHLSDEKQSPSYTAMLLKQRRIIDMRWPKLFHSDLAIQIPQNQPLSV